MTSTSPCWSNKYLILLAPCSPASSGLSTLYPRGLRWMWLRWVCACVCVVVRRSGCIYVWVYAGAQLGKTYCYVGDNVWTLPENFFPLTFPAYSVSSHFKTTSLTQLPMTTHTMTPHPHTEHSHKHTHRPEWHTNAYRYHCATSTHAGPSCTLSLTWPGCKHVRLLSVCLCTYGSHSQVSALRELIRGGSVSIAFGFILRSQINCPRV